VNKRESKMKHTWREQTVKIAFFDQPRFKYANIVGDRIALWSFDLELTYGGFDLIFCKTTWSRGKGESRKIRREQTRRRTRGIREKGRKGGRGKMKKNERGK
jgi:hypothetical protein